ncbi:MAG: replication-associated recombination protein A, partial [Planctomycetales bacterium]|nr:replication-associated recombination protein A [Planctomycetales bacterium]
MSLFEAGEEANRRKALPLAARMRPARLEEFVGQRHFLGEGKLLRRLLKADRLGSVIFYGPPGTGKTTLA